jgi:ribA/ribD-fused uncharacterized protein
VRYLKGMVLTRADLVARQDAGESLDFLFFWGHAPKSPGAVDASCLSQWFPRAFEVEGDRYLTAEHWMMAEKARLFGDRAALASILACGSPAEAKAHGRAVRGYDDVAWGRARSEAVVRGNVAKFGAHPDLRAFLLATKAKVLVEASPRDRIWGIGMGAKNPDARIPARWRGQNLLGFALMEARRLLADGSIHSRE